jgi:hypothetical protein
MDDAIISPYLPREILDISGVGEFSHFKLVIPAKAGIQKIYFLSGSPPTRGRWLDARLRGHDGKIPRRLRYSTGATIPSFSRCMRDERSELI